MKELAITVTKVKSGVKDNHNSTLLLIILSPYNAGIELQRITQPFRGHGDQIQMPNTALERSPPQRGRPAVWD
jgi:hypothetical protein